MIGLMSTGLIPAYTTGITEILALVPAQPGSLLGESEPDTISQPGLP